MKLMPLPDPLVPSKLERLDVPGKGGLWRISWKMAGAEKRRDEFRRLVANEHHHEPDTVAKLRTLVDLGLWNDFMDEAQLDQLLDDKREQGIGRQLGEVARSLFADARLAMAGKGPELLARVMFSSLDFKKAKPVPMEVLHLAIEAGLDPDMDVESPQEDRLLAHFARRGDKQRALLVLRAGANPREQALPMNTAAHILVERGSADDLALLGEMIKMGVDINDPGMVKDSKLQDAKLPPVVLAIGKFDVELFHKLIDMGATTNWQGHTAFHVVAGSRSKIAVEKALEMMRTLAAAGAEIDQANRRGETPLWKAIPQCADRALWLIKHGARTDIRVNIDDENNDEKNMQSVLERVVVACTHNEKWDKVVDAIEKRNPGCWDCPTSWASGGHATVSDLAIKNGGPWGARASARLLGKQVKRQDDPQATVRKPRL